MSEGSSSRMLRTTLLVLPFQIVFRAGEALLPVLLATWFGHGADTDTFMFATASFGFFGSLVFSLYQDSSLIPVLAETRLEHPERIPKILGALLLRTWIGGGALAVAIGALFSVYVLARYDGPIRAIALQMVPAFVLYLVFLSTRTFLGCVLTFARRFVVQPIVSGLATAAMLTCVLILKGRHGIASVPIGMLLGEIVASLGLWLALRRTALSIDLTRESPRELRALWRLLFAEVGGSAITRVNPVVDQLMAGIFAALGAGTLLRYSNDVSTVPTSLLQATLLPVLISHLSEDAARGNLAVFRITVRRTLWTVVVVLGLAGLVLHVVRGPLVQLVFRHGAMSADGAAGIAEILPYHLVGIPAFGALLVLVRAHTALKNSRIMIAMGILNASANLLFNLVLVRWLGVRGLALSTSLVSVAVAIELGRRLRWWTPPRK